MVREPSNWAQPRPGEHPVRLAVLLFALLGSPVAWSLHLLVVYFLVALFCTTGWAGGKVAVVVATLPFVAMSVASGWVAYRYWRRRGEQAWDGAAAEPGDWGAFLLVMGMLGAVLFTALIVAEALPPFFAPLCSERSS